MVMPPPADAGDTGNVGLIPGLGRSSGVANGVCVCVVKSCLTLCNPKDCSPPGSSVHGISQARILECCHFPSPGDLLNPGTEPLYLVSPAVAGSFFTTNANWEAQEVRTHSSVLSWKNSTDRGAWGATVQRVAKSWMDMHTHTQLDTTEHAP